MDGVVLRINERLQARYALLEPALITVTRSREAIIDGLAKSEEKDQARIVIALQRIFAGERLPDEFRFYLNFTSTKYTRESLDVDVHARKVVNLNNRAQFVDTTISVAAASHLLFVYESGSVI